MLYARALLVAGLAGLAAAFPADKAATDKTAKRELAGVLPDCGCTHYLKGARPMKIGEHLCLVSYEFESHGLPKDTKICLPVSKEVRIGLAEEFEEDWQGGCRSPEATKCKEDRSWEKKEYASCADFWAAPPADAKYKCDGTDPDKAKDGTFKVGGDENYPGSDETCPTDGCNSDICCCWGCDTS